MGVASHKAKGELGRITNTREKWPPLLDRQPAKDDKKVQMYYLKSHPDWKG